MKYRHEFKNKALGEAVYTIFGEEFVRDEIEQQMFDDDENIYLEVDERDANNKLFNAHVEFPKTEIEKKLVYDPVGWNPYPEVEPRENSYYIVQSEIDINIAHFSKGTSGPEKYDNRPSRWVVKDSATELKDVVAFRACPEPYRKPEKSE